ncbi:MAG TPA: CDP-alcohol phosphatidyltransferase family protein, partial [Amnibacterium sp.]|nr:CDP-alcohol phosphatidyltransferase family protein [Amnibacterium sp.]
MPSDEPVSDDLLTIPNVLSFARLALIPVFLGFLITGQDVLALVVLVAGGVTDFLDGFLARRLHQVSRLGKLLDPVADRLTILSAT